MGTAALDAYLGTGDAQFNAATRSLGNGFVGVKAGSGGTGAFNTKGLVMGYYDGNTVTALWNYAQHFAMSDNSFETTFGPSSSYRTMSSGSRFLRPTRPGTSPAPP